MGADEVKANGAGPMEDLSHQFPCDAATAVLHRYHELGPDTGTRHTERGDATRGQ